MKKIYKRSVTTAKGKHLSRTSSYLSDRSLWSRNFMSESILVGFASINRLWVSEDGLKGNKIQANLAVLYLCDSPMFCSPAVSTLLTNCNKS